LAFVLECLVMNGFKFLKRDKIFKLPKSPGVYVFKKGQAFLYIGKASNIQDRVKNHFQQSSYRDNLFMDQVKRVGYLKTDSEIEALILEANLIKKNQPRYNILWRDDKNYFFIAVTREKFPRVFWTHQTKIKEGKSKINSLFIGPFIEGRALKQTLRFLRKIFPYYTIKKHPKNLCLYCHLNLCPGPSPNLRGYIRNVENLIAFFRKGKKPVLNSLRKEMKLASSKQNFEKAAKIRDQINVLEKTISNIKLLRPDMYHLPKSLIYPALEWGKIGKELKEFLKIEGKVFRTEAYDISNIQGKLATGSMVTFKNGLADKNYYRRFKVNIHGKPNDIAMLKECLRRRFEHTEWGLPDLILIDGGKAQLNAAKSVISEKKLDIPIIALAKKNNKLYIENQKNPILLKNLPREVFNLVLQLRDEAHRFAINYHKKLRKKAFIS